MRKVILLLVVVSFASTSFLYAKDSPNKDRVSGSKKIIEQCSDTDAESKNPYTEGGTVYSYGKKHSADHCKSSNYLIEQFCDNDKPAWEAIKCSDELEGSTCVDNSEGLGECRLKAGWAGKIAKQFNSLTKNLFEKGPNRLFGPKIPKTQIIEVETSRHNTCVKYMSGEISCIGSNGGSQLGFKPKGEKNIEGSSAILDPISLPMYGKPDNFEIGYSQICAIKNGRTLCKGTVPSKAMCNDSGQPTEPPKPMFDIDGQVQDIQMGMHPTVSAVLTKSGQVYTCGWLEGSLGDGVTMKSSHPVHISDLDNIVEVDVAENGVAVYALNEDGEVFCWGRNSYGACAEDDLLAEIPTPIKIDRLPKAKAIADKCAIDIDGDVWCWGIQKLPGYDIDNRDPVRIEGLSNIVEIDDGFNFMCALDTEGDVHCWGSNLRGRLGNPSATDPSGPVKVSNLSNVSHISVGTGHACALKSDNSVWCWGGNISQQLGREDPDWYASKPFKMPF